MARTRPDHAPPPDRLLVGVVVGAHGVRGLVRVKSFTEQPDAITGLAGLSGADNRPMRLSLRGYHKGHVIAAIEGIADRDAALALKGTELFVDRAALPETDADEFYHADLLGLDVERVDGGRLGHVAAINDYGAGPVIDVTTPDRRTIVIPFSRDVVPEVDLARGRLVVAAPDGLLDDVAIVRGGSR